MTYLYLVSITVFMVLGAVLSTPTHSKTSKQSHSSSSHKTSVQDNVDEIEDEGWEYENTTIVDTRRILFSKSVKKGKRPYMVYLQLTGESAKAHKYRGWLCGGVILDKSYVLTSAACVEDADHFYIVSGTTKFVDSFDYKSDNCVCKHRRKVIWKCIPKNYKFDFQDSIKWSSNDIAIVKVNKPFRFGSCEKGCEFPTDSICYNNVSRELEKAGTKGFIAGWGSGSNFREGVYRRQHTPQNAKCLQEAKVCIMDNEACAKKWAQRFRSIITQYMICTKDVMKRLSEICDKKYANCTEMDGRRLEEEVEDTDLSFNSLNIDLGRHLRNPNDYTARRSGLQGGFCENDHGGPLIVKHQGKERVVGVISACKIDPKTHSCHGPFLYTSVYKNRQFISCAIHKDVEENCRRVFRTGITHEEWTVDWDGVDEDDNNNRSDDDSEEENEEKDNKVEEMPVERADEEEEKASEIKENEQSSGEDQQQTKESNNDARQSISESKSEEEKKVVRKPKSKREKTENKQEKVSDNRSNKKNKERSSKAQSQKNKSTKKRQSQKQKSAVKEEKQKDAVSYESTADENVNDLHSE